MDLVYVVGRPAAWGHNELRFSIRSAEKYLKFDKLFIVGYKPMFLRREAIHFLIEDDKGHKYDNVTAKVKFILDCDQISDDFIYMNDDFFLLRKFDQIPYLWNGKIKNWVENYPARKGKYYRNICEMYKYLPDGKFFETHFPIVFNKQKAKAVIDKYNLKITLMLRSYYGNEYESQLAPIEESLDYKVASTGSRIKTINDLPVGAPFVSCSNESANNAMFKNFLLTKFPKKSSFE
jgi:hypothetical protein